MNMEKHLQDSNFFERLVNKYPGHDPRYERKFRFPVGQAVSIENLLTVHSFQPVFKPRSVASIYFDTLNYDFAIDNIEGVPVRVKPRLRNYPDDAANGCTLEYKCKKGFLGYKFSRKPFLNSLEQSASQIHMDIGVEVLPTIQVSYERKYFVNPLGIRATIDTNIYASSKEAFINLSTFLDFEVLELKYPIGLDQYVRQILYGSISKFAPTRLNKSSKYIEGLLRLRLI